MKKYYITFCTILLTGFVYCQNYDFGIIHISNYDFKVVAIPDFTSSENTDISDIGFALALPAGAADVINANASLSGRTGSVQEFDADFLTGLGLGDGTKDIFQFNIPPGQTLLSHTTGEQIDLFTFQISNMPTTGEMHFLLNSDPIAVGASGVLDSFYSSNITPSIPGSITSDYFRMPFSGLDSFMFSTLSLENTILTDDTISVFPNPVSNTLTIKSSQKIKNIELYTILGAQVLKINNAEHINVSKFETGVYLLKINTESSSLTKRIIIE